MVDATIILKGTKWSKWHLTSFCYLCQTCSPWKWILSLLSSFKMIRLDMQCNKRHNGLNRATIPELEYLTKFTLVPGITIIASTIMHRKIVLTKIAVERALLSDRICWNIIAMQDKVFL